MQKMIGVFLRSFLFLQVVTATSQPLPPCQANNIDSLLVAGDLKAASAFLDRKKVEAELTTDYRSLIGRLEAAPGLADSLVLSIVRGGLIYLDKYGPVDASPLASICYNEYHAEYDRKQYLEAYERYIVADFLRQRFVRCERLRLRGNMARAKQALQKGDLDQARELIALFKREPSSSAFATFGDTLTSAYASMEKQLHETVATRKYESSRRFFSPRILFAVGGAISPTYTLGFNELTFHRGDPSSATVMNDRGDAVSIAPLGFAVDLGYCMTPSMVLGLGYQRSSGKEDGSIFFGAPPVTLKYNAEVRIETVDFWLKYLLDSREGIRPYVTIGGGYAKVRLIPEGVTGETNRIYVVGSEEGAAHAAGEIGVEYVASIEFPICFQGFAHVLVNASKSEGVMKKAQVLFGMKLGWYF